MQCTAEHVNEDAPHKSQRCIKNRRHLGKHFDQYGDSWDNEHDACSASIPEFVREQLLTGLKASTAEEKHRALFALARGLGYDEMLRAEGLTPLKV